jgi:signal transduction histidine kinase
LLCCMYPEQGFRQVEKLMARQPKPGFLPIATSTQRPAKNEKPWKTLFMAYFTGAENGRFDLGRVFTVILAALLVAMIALTWLPAHISANLIVPGEIILIIIAVIINGRIYKRQPPHASQYIVASLVLQVVIIEVSNWVDPSNSLFFQYFALPFQVYRFFGDKAGLRVSILTWFAYAIHSLFVFKEFQIYLLALLAGTLAMVMLVSKYRQDLRERVERERREQLLQELEVSHRQLKAYSEQIEELATIEERNRLAREIHDSLGHYLTAINIQLEKAMLQHDDKPDEAMQTISETKRLASEALQDVRRSVATLREQAVPTFSVVENLGRLVVEVRNNHHFELKLEIEGSEQDFSNQILQTLYRVAQEGLTNIEKYASPESVLVRLELGKTEARLLIQDDGAGFDTARLRKPGRGGLLGGYGLQGIRERLELVGGSFELVSAPGSGTTLRVTAPKDPFKIHSVKKAAVAVAGNL